MGMAGHFKSNWKAKYRHG